MVTSIAAQPRVACIMPRRRHAGGPRLGRRVDLGAIEVTLTGSGGTVAEIATKNAQAGILAHSGALYADGTFGGLGRVRDGGACRVWAVRVRAGEPA